MRAGTTAAAATSAAVTWTSDEVVGRLGGVTFQAQLAGSVVGAGYAFAAGLVVYALLRSLLGLRLTPEEERRGADLSIHRITANPEADIIG